MKRSSCFSLPLYSTQCQKWSPSLDESSNLSEPSTPPEAKLQWRGVHLYQGELVIASVTEHRRWWVVKSTRSGTPEQRLSKKDFPKLEFVQQKYASDLLVAAYTLRDPLKRQVAVLMLQALLATR